MPFDVITGKRSYSNMLIQRLVVSTDEKSEFSLVAQIGCRQVIIVSTSSAPSTGQSSQPSDQGSPANTATSQDQGPQSTTDPPAGAQNQIASTSAANDPNGAAADKGINLQAGGGATLSTDVGPLG